MSIHRPVQHLTRDLRGLKILTTLIFWRPVCPARARSPGGAVGRQRAGQRCGGIFRSGMSRNREGISI